MYWQKMWILFVLSRSQGSSLILRKLTISPPPPPPPPISRVLIDFQFHTTSSTNCFSSHIKLGVAWSTITFIHVSLYNL